MQIKKLSPKVIEKLGYYVYLYINPLDNSIFYVGKGKGNRVFAHLDDNIESQTAKIVRQIHSRGKGPRIEILVHDLPDEITALRIEAAVIDLIGKEKLTNQAGGWGSNIVGRMDINEIITLYDSEPVEIHESALLIRINKLYRYGMDEIGLYEATRGVWKVGEKRKKAQYAFAVYKGIVREVYRIHDWSRAGTTTYKTRLQEKFNKPNRWEFEGKVAEDNVRKKYLNKSVDRYFAVGSQNPIKYVNC